MDILQKLLKLQRQKEEPQGAFQDLLTQYMHHLNVPSEDEYTEDFQNAIFALRPEYRQALSEASRQNIPGLDDRNDLNIGQAKNELQAMFSGNSDYLKSLADRKR